MYSSILLVIILIYLQKCLIPMFPSPSFSPVMSSCTTCTAIVQRFSASALLTFWVGCFFVVWLPGGDCPLHYRKFSRIPGLYSLETNNTLLGVPTKTISRCFQISFRQQNHPDGGGGWGRERKITLVGNYSVLVFYYCCNRLPVGGLKHMNILSSSSQKSDSHSSSHRQGKA